MFAMIPPKSLGSNMVLTLLSLQIKFQDPSQDWKICNAWFVKQTDFWTTFLMRDIPQPMTDASTEKSHNSEAS